MFLCSVSAVYYYIHIVLYDIASYENNRETSGNGKGKISDCYGGNEKYHFSASVGVAFYPEDGIETERLMANADEALYHSKKSGKNQYTIYGQKE